jgi:exosortase
MTTRFFGRRIPPAAKAVLLVAAGAYLFAPVVLRIVRVWWTSDSQSHGIVIPFAVLYFVWQRRARLRTVPPQPSPIAFFLALLAVASLGLGALGDLLSAQVFAVVLYVWVVVLAVWGRRSWRILACPLLFLVFLVPVPTFILNRVSLPLQLFAAQSAGRVLDMLGIPVLIEGTYIHLSHTVLQVAVACAGLRFLESTTIMGVLIAYWTQETLGRRLLVATLAIPMAILANAARVTVTGVLAHVFGPETAVGFIHSATGTVMFWAALAALFFTSAAIRRIGR